MLKIAVLVSGDGSNLQAIIDAIAKKEINAEIVKVISSRPGVYAMERAQKANIPTELVDRKQFSSDEEFDKALLERLEGTQVELIVLAGFLRVFGKEFVEVYRNRIINVHPSLIPSFCGKGLYGPKVHRAAIEAGVRVSGATVFFVDEGCDTGPIMLQKAVCVKQCDDAVSLQKKVLLAEWVLLPKAIGLIADGHVSVKHGRVIIREKRV